MNHCAYEQSAFAACDVVCPKPRRFGSGHIRPLRSQINQQAEICDAKAGSELLDMILAKGNYAVEKSTAHVASSPPFFCGSPPSRASNPVIQDAQFNNEKFTQPITLAPSPSPARTGGGCVRMKFGQKPAAVRIEGFDCLGRDRQNRSISAVA